MFLENGTVNAKNFTHPCKYIVEGRDSGIAPPGVCRELEFPPTEELSRPKRELFLWDISLVF